MFVLNRVRLIIEILSSQKSSTGSRSMHEQVHVSFGALLNAETAVTVEACESRARHPTKFYSLTVITDRKKRFCKK